MNLEWLKPSAPLLIPIVFYANAIRRDQLGRPLPMIRLVVAANTLIACFFAYSDALGNHPVSFVITAVGLLASSLAFYVMNRRGKLNHRLVALSEILFLTPLSLTMLLI